MGWVNLHSEHVRALWGNPCSVGCQSFLWPAIIRHREKVEGDWGCKVAACGLTRGPPVCWLERLYKAAHFFYLFIFWDCRPCQHKWERAVEQQRIGPVRQLVLWPHICFYCRQSTRRDELKVAAIKMSEPCANTQHSVCICCQQSLFALSMKATGREDKKKNCIFCVQYIWLWLCINVALSELKVVCVGLLDVGHIKYLLLT